MSDDNMIIVGMGENIEKHNLAELMDIDISDIPEYRAGPLPKGIYTFQLKDIGQGTFETEDGTRARYEIENTVVNVLQLAEKVTPEEEQLLLGRTARVNIAIFEPMKAIGTLKAFLVDIGMQGSGNLRDLCNEATGTMFNAKITHQKDRNDEDKYYANIDLNSIQPAKM